MVRGDTNQTSPRLGCRLVRAHDLRAADALQLAAAVDLRGRGETTPPFVTLDERLAFAAAREGFPVLPG